MGGMRTSAVDILYDMYVIYLWVVHKGLVYMIVYMSIYAYGVVVYNVDLAVIMMQVKSVEYYW